MRSGSRMRSNTGFIVHPFETGDNKFHASFGRNLNKTNKSFNTLAKAKEYLQRNKVKSALYDSPSGSRNINIDMIKKQIRAKVKKKRFDTFNNDPLKDLLKRLPQ